MKKIKLGIDALLMAVIVLLTERVSIACIYFASALLHELGHLAAAKLRGIEIKEMRIGITGARICTGADIGSYKDEFILCMAGPLVNAVIVALGVIAAYIYDAPPDTLADAAQRFFMGCEPSFMGAAAFFVLCAAVQGIVNLAPIRTLDGGRMLYCISAMLFSQRTAERIVGASSAVCAFILWTVALFLMLRIGEGLGIYAFCACLFFTTLRDRDLVKN